MSGSSRNRGPAPAYQQYPGAPFRYHYDGPASGSASASAGHRGSTAQSVGSQRSTHDPATSSEQGQGGLPSTIRSNASATGSASGSYGAPGRPLLTDPALEHPPRATDKLRLMYLPPDVYNFDNEFGGPVEYKARPGFNTSGKEVTLQINSYSVSQLPNKPAWQYDVHVGNGAEKRAIISKVWASTSRKRYVPDPIIFDGNKLAWTNRELPDAVFSVDLDAEHGRRPGKANNTFKVAFRKTKRLNIAVVEAWLEKKMSFTNDVAEGLNFMQHLLRDTPEKTENILCIRNKFFTRNGERADLGGSVEVWRGVFQSLRPTHPGRLTVNLDVANTCFWRPKSLSETICMRWRYDSVDQLAFELGPQDDYHSPTGKSDSKLFNILKHYAKLKVYPSYKGCPCEGRMFTIKDFNRANAKEFKIDLKDPATGKVEYVSIYDYFRQKYDIHLRWWKLPVCRMTNEKVVYPMELLYLFPAQKYNYRLDERQTAKMIEFAVSRPKVRINAMNEGKNWLNWGNDRALAAFGLKIDPNMIKTKARLLPNPKIKFGNSEIDPKTNGRWDLRGKKFYSGNPTELVSWGIGLFPGRGAPEKPQIEKFAQEFIKMYRQHGGKVANHMPHIMKVNSDAATGVEELFLGTGNHFNVRPTLLIFLVHNKDSFHYLRIKKSTDCRYGVVSQVMQVKSTVQIRPQYISNVLMKVNAKLGGCTARAISQGNSGFKGGLKPYTMIIGADVSHPSPGSEQPSTAALSMSMDQFGGRYAAAVQTNGHRVEMITEMNFKNMLFPIANWWAQNTGNGRSPQHIYYIRDGVSEGQYQHVLQIEVPHIKTVMSKIANKEWDGTITVIIASKRHNVRMFPNPTDSGSADGNGNPLPGCVVERDCTTTNVWDFYLVSHIALQGTTRPVHYSVIRDDLNHPPDYLMNMIYEHCYQYIRSTTSVSLHPAVYYAHLASNRAKAHENIPSAKGPTGGANFKLNTNKRKDPEPIETEIQPLIPLFEKSQIRWQMWYV